MANVYQEMRFAKDECYTTQCESEKLVNFISPLVSKDKLIWLPFDNELSNIYKELIKKGYKCILSNLELGLDFYNYEPDQWDMIITNPPFSKRTKLMQRLISFDKPFIILQATQYFNNQKSVNYLCVKDFQFIMPSSRMSFLTYKEKADMVESSKSGTAFYSFWLCYKIGLQQTFNQLKDSGKEKIIERYDRKGNAIVDNHWNLFTIEKGER